MYRKTGIAFVLLMGLFIASFTSIDMSLEGAARPSLREREIHNQVFRGIKVFRNYIKDSLLQEVSRKYPDEKKIRHCFIKARLLFKKFEWATSYFTADLTKRLNGPPVQEIENADLLDPSLARGSDPMGLQVVEEYIYPHIDTLHQKELIASVSHLATNTDYLISYYADHSFADWRILDAAKLEVFRIVSLGITGFDAALSLNSIEESAVSLKSLQQVLRHYVRKKNSSSLLHTLNTSIDYLDQHADFNSFDRAAFITAYANKISTGIAALQRDLPGRKIKYNRMLNQEVNTLFDSGAFNANAFSPGPKFYMTEAKVRLGKRLFFDPALSGTKTRSCATCHRPELDYTDGLTTPTDIHDSTKHLARNAPTLLNAALQSNYFYDMRALTLEDQIRDVISNKQEMGGSLEAVVQYISTDSSYKRSFANAFDGDKWDRGIDADKVTNALASYIRSLVKLNSRFDQYMRGRKNALTQQEVKGFNLFMGKAKCGTCHFAPLFNGITPPKYVQSESEVLGVPASLTDSMLDPDLGYYAVIGVESYRYAFKIPTVRNISKTAPYMHNGIYRTLEEVMDFYNNAGATGLGISLPNQTLSTDTLGLTTDEQASVIAFMKSLESQ